MIEGLENCLPRNQVEMQMAELKGFPADMRLACQLRPTGPVSVSPLGNVGTAAEHVAHEEVCAFVSFDLLNCQALAQGLECRQGVDGP